MKIVCCIDYNLTIELINLYSTIFVLMTRNKVVDCDSFMTKEMKCYINIIDSNNETKTYNTDSIVKTRAIHFLKKGYPNEYYPNFVSYRKGLGFNSISKIEIEGIETKNPYELAYLGSYNTHPKSGRLAKMLESEISAVVTLSDGSKIKLKEQEDALMVSMMNNAELYINGDRVYDVINVDDNNYISIFELDTSSHIFLGKVFGGYDKFLKHYDYDFKRIIRKEEIWPAEFLINKFCNKAKREINVRIQEILIGEKYSSLITEENGEMNIYKTFLPDALILKDISGCDAFMEEKTVN